MQPRLFRVERDTDISGASGTGHVADGVLWPDRTVTMRWRGERASTVHWDDLADAIEIHGHNGATRFVFDDEIENAASPTEFTQRGFAAVPPPAWIGVRFKEVNDRPDHMGPA